MPLNPYFDEMIELQLDDLDVLHRMLKDRIQKKMTIKVIDEKTRGTVEKGPKYIRGIVYSSEDYIEFGWFKPSPSDNINILYEDASYIGISKEAISGLIWSNKLGYYIFTKDISPEDIIVHKLYKGQGNFPYQFPKRYEAIENFNIFKDSQIVLEEAHHPLSKYLGYTFGLEFETSMGYIPQEKCFRDGLIPLRDGSISGIEYSTIVLEGNRGLNLLKQQLNTLKEYTDFNKECALHIHMGGFPVDPIYISALYSVWYLVERELACGYVPALTFRTAEYKSNGKDYCKKLNLYSNFCDLFSDITGKNYLGSLVQPHPADVERRAKWNIKARYYGLNLVNMLCYKGPKTVEFRFLRPTFNYRKITLWLYILNAVLKYAENLAATWEEHNCNIDRMLNYLMRKEVGISKILNTIYDEDTYKYLTGEIRLLKLAVKAQTNNGDLCGQDIKFEDELFV